MKTWKRVLLMAFALLCCSAVAFGDMGPKDRLTIRLTNPPDEPYYLDLLTQSPGDYDNLGEKRYTLDPDILSCLFQYEGEGWFPALAGGTRIPLFGKLTGEPNGDAMIHTFSYFGLPSTYRIIVAAQNGQVVVSEPRTRQVLQGTVTFDYATGELTSPPLWIAYLVQFLSTYIPTLAVEGVILLLFGFSLKENGKVFFLVNLATQLLLTATLGATLLKQGPLAAYFTQFPVEIAILVAEALLYRRFLKGRSPARRTAYGAAANLASWGLGFFLLSQQYGFLLHFL